MEQLSEKIIETLNKNSTINFLNAARQLINLLEDDSIQKDVFCGESHICLAELYRTALYLEPVDLIYSKVEDEFTGISNEHLRKININLISKLGQECLYWKVFDPTLSKKNEPVQRWLVDDFADIYAELKEELIKIDRIKTNQSIEDALWQLKFGFNHHWGNRCSDGIRALHYLWYQGKVVM